MNRQLLASLIAIIVIAALPAMGGYPIFLMKVMCYALFACAFNLLIGYVGLLSFGHALFFGWGAYIAAHLAKDPTLAPLVKARPSLRVPGARDGFDAARCTISRTPEREEFPPKYRKAEPHRHR